MQEYAAQRGLHRTMIPVPVLTPRLSSLWLWLVTPVYAGVGRKLVDSPAERDGRRGRSRARGVPGAAARLPRRDRARARVRGPGDRADALVGRGVRRDAPSYGGVRHGSRLVDSRVDTVPAAAGSRLRADPADRRRDGLVQGRSPSGGCAACSTCSSAAPASGGGGATRSGSRSATRSTSGASRRSSPIGCCACTPR